MELGRNLGLVCFYELVKFYFFGEFMVVGMVLEINDKVFLFFRLEVERIRGILEE